MRYIAYLLDKPGKRYHTLELVQGFEVNIHTPNEYDAMTNEQLEEMGMGKAGKTIKDEKRYFDKAKELLGDLQKAKEGGIPLEIEEAQNNYDQYMDFVSRVKRDNVDPGIEKERKRVSNLIKYAISHINKIHPQLWEHLKKSTTTGTYCSYQPQNGSIVWHIKY